MYKQLQAGSHLEKLYAEYLKRHAALVKCGAKMYSTPLSPSSFGVLWGRWCDRYGALAGCPEIWGEAFLEHEFGPLV